MKVSFDEIGKIAILKFNYPTLCATDLSRLEKETNQLSKAGFSCILIKIQNDARIKYSGIAAITELIRRKKNKLVIAVVCKPSQFEKAITPNIKMLLPVFKSVEEAVASDMLRGQTLRGVKAVIFCNETLKDSFQVLEKETYSSQLVSERIQNISRIIDNLAELGVRDFLLNPGISGPEIHSRFPHSSRLSVTFLNEGCYTRASGWVPFSLGTAESLINMHTKLNAFNEDFIAIPAHTYSEINFAEIMRGHKTTKSDVTIVQRREKHTVPKREEIARECNSETSETNGKRKRKTEMVSAYVISPRVLRNCSAPPGSTIQDHLIPYLSSMGYKINRHYFGETHRPNKPPFSDQSFLQPVLNEDLTNLKLNDLVRIRQSKASQLANVTLNASPLGSSRIGDHTEVEPTERMVGSHVVGRGANKSRPTVPLQEVKSLGTDTREP